MRIKMGTIISIFVLAFFIQGCAKDTKLENTEFDGTKYLQISDLTDAAADLENYAEKAEVVENPDYALSVPTYITKIDGIWFIVDCYHNRVVYNDNVDESLTGFDIMCSEAVMPHTIASDGIVYLIDDTENNRVLIYEKSSGKFILTQKFDNIGVRPHFTVYDEATDTFYVWSSESGELYCFRHTKDSSRMYLTEIRKIDELADTYVRSFTIIDGDIYFVSGISEKGVAPRILRCDLKNLKIKKEYPVPDQLAGMAQISFIEGKYYITVSTDITGNQDYATIVRTDSLEDLAEGKFEDIYSRYFVGGGTPYYITKVDDTYYLTEHRLASHSIWSFKVKDGEICDVQTLY